MKYSAIIFFNLIFGFSFGQSFTYPIINQTAISEGDFAPSNWRVLKLAKGDLNNDKIDDIALVIEYKDSAVISNQLAEYIDTVVCKPRILIIAFYNHAKKQYEKVEQSNTFILCHVNPLMDEPFKAITISKKIIKIDFHLWNSEDSWWMSNPSYKFLFKDNDFILTGADSHIENRATGSREIRKYNFITKKVKVNSSFYPTKKPKTWRKLEIKELPTLKTLKTPFTYKVENDYYI